VGSSLKREHADKQALEREDQKGKSPPSDPGRREATQHETVKLPEVGGTRG
jgi:hypothetical protein